MEQLYNSVAMRLGLDDMHNDADDSINMKVDALEPDSEPTVETRR